MHNIPAIHHWWFQVTPNSHWGSGGSGHCRCAIQIVRAMDGCRYEDPTVNPWIEVISSTLTTVPRIRRPTNFSSRVSAKHSFLHLLNSSLLRYGPTRPFDTAKWDERVPIKTLSGAVSPSTPLTPNKQSGWRAPSSSSVHAAP